jgi:ubiquinone/menaquinone biosynthesis C-methylase UbiE
VDPNPYFEEAVKRNLQKHPGVNLERRLVCRAEDMSDIKDNSVDIVVATLVFCNVNKVAVVFNEIIRVLVPVRT